MPSVEDVLAVQFEAYRTNEPEVVWAKIEANHQVGDLVTGRIAARFPFGLAIDFGAEFPGMLLGTRIPDMTAEELQQNTKFATGSIVTARIERFATTARQIGLTQLGDSTV